MPDLTACAITTPTNPWAMNIIQAKTSCAATNTGGNGTLHVQWQLDGTNAVGTGNQSNSTYALNPTVESLSVGSHNLTIKEWDDSAAHNSYATAVVSTAVLIVVSAAMVFTLVPASPRTIMNTETFIEVPTITGGANASNFAYLWQSCTVDGNNQAALSPSITTASLTQTPTAAGVYYYVLRVTESGLGANNVTYSGVLTVTVASFYTTLAGATGYLGEIAKAVS